ERGFRTTPEDSKIVRSKREIITFVTFLYTHNLVAFAPFISYNIINEMQIQLNRQFGAGYPNKKDSLLY
ncbi:MAG TPA: hypothetical protein VI776_15730, partial [Anaerolineales bacterium]|nr:hypothetical protein [Anaerolineales bacterium]